MCAPVTLIDKMAFRPRRTTEAAHQAGRREIGGRSDIADLIEAAADVHAWTRKAAIAGLAEIGPCEGVPAAVEALEHSSDRVRCAAVRALWHWAGAVQLADAVSCLPPGSPSRALALAAIANLDEPKTAAVLARSLVHGRTQEALSHDEVELVLRLCRAGPESPASDDVVDVLTEGLEDESDEVAGRAEDFLLRLGQDAAPALIAVAELSPAPSRAVGVLGQIGGTLALEPLIRAVEHADSRTREEACVALGELRDPVSVEALLRATRDPEHSVRVEAAAALDRIGTAAVVASLSAILTSGTAVAKPRQRKAPAAKNGSTPTGRASSKARRPPPRRT